MPKSINGGWRGFSTLLQVDRLTAQPVNRLVEFTGEPFGSEANNFFTNEAEINGGILATRKKLLNTKLEAQHEAKCFPDLVGLFASMAMGLDVSSQIAASLAYRHEISIDLNRVELAYRTMVENDGDEQKSYTGVACAGYEIKAERGGFLEMSANLIGRGDETPNADPQPAILDEPYLCYGDTNFRKGGTFDGSAVTGGTPLSPELLNFSFKFSNGGQGKYHFGDNSGNVGRVQRGERFEVGLEAGFEIETEDHRAGWKNGDEFVIEIPAIGGEADAGNDYTVNIILTKAVYANAKKSRDGELLKIDGDFKGLDDGTYGGLRLQVVNLHAASYTATV